MIKEALIKKLQGDIAVAEANIKIAINGTPQVVADHIDHIATVEKEVEKLSCAQDKLKALQNLEH